MKNVITIVLIFSFAIGINAVNNSTISFPNILNIAYTPKDAQSECTGLFTDAGSWIGFSIPTTKEWVNGFCGPYIIDNSQWISKSIAEVGVEINGRKINANEFITDSTSYFPGFLYMKSKFKGVSVVQQLYFVDKNHSLLELNSEKARWNVNSSIWLSGSTFRRDKNNLIFNLGKGGILVVSFPTDYKIASDDKSYNAKSTKTSNKTYVLISFYNDEKQMFESASMAQSILKSPTIYIAQNKVRWNGYLTKVLRNDMPKDYNRVAVKSVITLISNWRCSKGDLLHEGVMPSHAHFLGFWAWDSWRHAYALARFAPELAKNQVRAMFDYQTNDGMIVDVIRTDKSKNNLLDSKPPLAAWAVLEIFKQTKDTDFVKEMFPKLIKYNQWWYKNRDHNQNGICEFGSTNGKTQPAKYESGMDNAIRFDSSVVVRNNATAWSFNQESVDLNSFLFLENNILREMASLLNVPYIQVVDGVKLDKYFFDTSKGYYYDRRFNGDFVDIEGCEGFTPMWVKMASKENAKSVVLMYEKPNKFSSYIPFPTVSIDNPKYIYNGYWRGPIWLDQVYLGISGLRNYGYKQQADKYTNQVFDRLYGVKSDAPIYENYDPKTGECLRAPHFSWSAVHLLMLYWEYGK
ncbi:MAG: trehalase family glycosidase [Sulfuricurvum sp.]|nr:trehalase family glycosidase [Sulfuricurvum sp.]